MDEGRASVVDGAGDGLADGAVDGVAAGAVADGADDGLAGAVVELDDAEFVSRSGFWRMNSDLSTGLCSLGPTRRTSSEMLPLKCCERSSCVVGSPDF